MSIELKPIEVEYCRTCPSCLEPLLRVTTQKEEVVTEDGWISDGDTIFGLYGKLVEAGLENEVDTSDHNVWYYQNYDYMLWVGHCPSCENEFFVIDASMIDDRVAVNPWFVESYFHQNLEIPDPTYGLANQGGEQWLVTRHETEMGVCLTHSFGPFAIKDDTLIGPNGVSLCSGELASVDHAATLLLKKWPALKTLARAVNDKP